MKREEERGPPPTLSSVSGLGRFLGLFCDEAALDAGLCCEAAAALDAGLFCDEAAVGRETGLVSVVTFSNKPIPTVDL